jgi:prepilin-type N-terminal cleavage/methylation domain-containing protein
MFCRFHLKSSHEEGLTLVELIIVVAIILLISALSYLSFNSLNKSQILKRDASALISLLEEARSSTLSSKEASQYGVYLSDSESKIVLFKGSQYAENDPDNEEVSLDDNVSITVNLIGTASSTVIFDRLEGTTEQHGSVIFSLINKPAGTLTVAIYPTGVAELLP